MKTIELILITNSEKLQSQLMGIFSGDAQVKVRNWQGGSQSVSDTISIQVHSFYYYTDAPAIWELTSRKVLGALFVFEMNSKNPWKEIIPLITGWRNSMDIPIILGVEGTDAQARNKIQTELPLAKSMPVLTIESNQPETGKLFWKNSFKYFTEFWKKDIGVS